MKPAEWAAKWRIGFAGLDEIFAEAMAQARANALEEAAQTVRRVNEAADVPGGNNTRPRKWALECAEIAIRSLAAAPSGDAKGTRCTDDTPPWFSGHWREWHRGHGCELDPDVAPAASEKEGTP